MYDVRIDWMQDDAADMMAFVEAHVLPCLAFVHTLVDTYTGIGRPARVVFTRSDPDDARTPVDRNITNGHTGFLVKYWGESRSVIVRVPNSAGCIGYIHLSGPGRIDIDIHYTTAAYGWAYIGKGKMAEQRTTF